MIERNQFRMPWSPKKATSDPNAAASPGNRPRFPSYTSEGSLGAGNRPRFPSFTSESSIGAGNNRPRLPSSGENSCASTVGTSGRKERVSAEEERLVKARKAVDSYLRKLGNVTGKPLALNRETGMCYFPYQKFIIVLEIPADHPGSLYMYTCVCRFENSDNVMRIMQTALELNYMQHRTRGGTLGLERTEVNLCLSTPLTSLSSGGLQRLIDDFLHTASEVHTQLERAKK